MTNKTDVVINNPNLEKESVSPTDSGFIPYCQHSIDENEILEVIDTLNSSWLTKGPKTIRFEEEFSAYVGSSYTIALNSCTSALHIALAAHNIQAGDEVITTPFTFCATAEVIEYQGAIPVFVDIDRDSFNIDVELIEQKITPKTKAILPVHYGGIPCHLDSIYEIAKKYHLMVLEDAAHALGTEYDHRKIGSNGNPVAFSFYPTKNITTGEGGALTTNDKNLAERYRVLSLHGISKDAWKRYSSAGQWYYEVEELGYKYNFTDLQAALGLQQLKKLDHFNAVREKYARIYFEELQTIPEIRMPGWYYQYFNTLRYNGIRSCWHLFVVLLDTEALLIDRNQFIEELKSRGIGSSVHFIPLHLHPFYSKKYGYRRGDFPVSEDIYSQIISLPLYPKLTKDQIDYIIKTLRELVEQYHI